MVPSVRPLGGDIALTEIRVAKDQLEDLLALLQDLVPVGNEEEAL